MNTKLIQQYGEEILCYRLRTARQKKRMQYKDFEKKLLKINREERKLVIKQRNIRWEPLVPPFQRGWKRHFVLREDVAVSRRAELFENILKKINTEDWSHRRDFKVKKRRYGQKKYIVKGQQLLKPYDCEFQAMNFSEDERKLFHEVIDYENGGKQIVKRYVFSEPWRFVLRVRPNMITMVKKNDALIESRQKEICNYLERNKLREKLFKLLHGYNVWRPYYSKREYKEKYVYKNKAFSQVLYLINEENKSHGTTTMEKIEWTTDPATPGT